MSEVKKEVPIQPCEEACYFCGEAALGVACDGTPTCGGDDCEPIDPDFFGEEDAS